MKELLNLVIERIRLRENTHIKGARGIGKTTFLKEIERKGYGIYAPSHPLKQLLLSITSEKKGTIYELSRLVEPEETTLLLDDVELMTRVTRRFLKRMIAHGLVVVSAGSRNVFGFFEVKLRELSFEESVKLVSRKVRNRELARIIAREVGGNPSLLLSAARKAVARKDIKTVKGFKEFRKSLSLLKERKDILNPAFISIVSGALISARYFFYTQRMFKEGYIAAMIAYALLTVGRIRKRT